MEAAQGARSRGERQQPLAERQPGSGGAQRAGVGGQRQQPAGRALQRVGPPEHVPQVLLAVDHGQLPGPGGAVRGQLGEGGEGVAAAAGGTRPGLSRHAARLGGGQQADGRPVVDGLGAVSEQLLGGPAPLGDPPLAVDQHDGEPDQGDHPRGLVARCGAGLRSGARRTRCGVWVVHHGFGLLPPGRHAWRRPVLRRKACCADTSEARTGRDSIAKRGDSSVSVACHTPCAPPHSPSGPQAGPGPDGRVAARARPAPHRTAGDGGQR